MTLIILLVLAGIPLLSIGWFIWADRRFKNLRAPAAVRIGSGVTLLLILASFAWIVLARQDLLPARVPSFLYSLLLVWGMLSLPLLALPWMFGWSFVTIFQKIRAWKNPAPPHAEPAHEAAEDESRRRFLGTTAVALPVIAAFGGTAVGMSQRNQFRIREMTVAIPGLPRDLEGLRIAQLSDTHVGKFTHGKLLDALADATNSLKADLVLLTGDLIDQSLDDLPEALDMVAKLDPRSGLYLIEGNHDLFQSAEKFAQGVKDRGFQLLRNENAVLEVKGHPLELMGIRWTRHGETFDHVVDQVNAQRTADAFPILMAHHPHAFDRAAHHNLPLTLAGHTHGGQIMLTPTIGAGPLFFKYWSGLYQQRDSRLIVSNGAGNWFPVRTAAPAEIVHVRLVRG